MVKTKILRKEDPHNAEEFGHELYEKTIDDLEQIEKVLGAANIQYQMLASKLAGEILQCAIEFFNVFITIVKIPNLYISSTTS